MSDYTGEFLIHMNNGSIIKTAGFDLIEGVREAIKQSWSGHGSFKDGLQAGERDRQFVINPASVSHIEDIR